MPQDSGALRVDGGDYAAQVGRFGAPNPTRFFNRPILRSQELSRRGDSGYEGASNLRAARLRLGKSGARVGRRRRANPTIFSHALLNLDNPVN